MTKVLKWKYSSDGVSGVFADGRPWEPMTVRECLATCQATPEGTAYIGDGPNGLVI